MKEFSATDAWAHGLRFFSGRAGAHLAILGGVGILIPFVLQFLAAGRAPGMLDPMAMSSAAMSASQGTVIAVVAATTLGYVLQIGSFFASWRLGFGRAESVAGALGFGLGAGLLSVVAVASVVGLIGFGLAQITPWLGVAVGAVALMLVIAMLWTTFACLLAVAISLGLGLSMILGTVSGNPGFAATLVGGSGAVVVLVIIFAALMLWLAARLSCTTAVLAERRSFDLPAAARESWALTWEAEWQIVRYLGLIGLVVAFGLFGLVFLAGIAVARGMAVEPSLGVGIGASLIQMILTLPIAYLAVLVPAGIHRALAGAPAPVEVFA